MSKPADDRTSSEAWLRGREALEQGDHGEARAQLEQAFAASTGDPEVMSWYGLALTLEGADRLRGMAFCEQAVRRCGHQAPAALHLNLARAYLAVNYKALSVQALRNGARTEPDHPGIHALLVELGIRRRPIFPFLRRSNPLNKYLGLLRHRLFPPPQDV